MVSTRGSQSLPSLASPTALEQGIAVDATAYDTGVVDVDKDIKYALALSASRPEDPYVLQRVMSTRQCEMLVALSEMQTIKTMKQQAQQGKKTAPSAGSSRALGAGRLAVVSGVAPRDRSAEAADHSAEAAAVSRMPGTSKVSKLADLKQKNRTTSLASKLDVLEELLENSRSC